MKRLGASVSGILLLSLCGCIPKVSLTVETRDPQGSVIDRATVTNSDANGRDFRVNGNGSVMVTASAEDRNGLTGLNISGGFSCNRTGQVQQGSLSMSDPNLPGQNPTTSSFSQTFQVQCGGGTYQATLTACASDSKGRSCTKEANLK